MDRPARRPGPPVDAARLQPDNQGDIHRVDEGLVGAWLDDPDLAAELADELEQLERLRRLQADEELLLALQLEQFTGRLWERFSRELTRYGLGVLQDHGHRTGRQPQQRNSSPQCHHRQVREGLHGRTSPQHHGHRTRLSINRIRRCPLGSTGGSRGHQTDPLPKGEIP